MAIATPAPVLDLLRRHLPFDQMAPEHLAELAGRLTLAFHARDEVVVSPDDGPARRFHIIKQGHVRGLTPGPDGRFIWEKGPGECFPIGALMDRRPVVNAQVAVEDTLCLELEREDFDRIVALSPAFRVFMAGNQGMLAQALRLQVQSASGTRAAEDLPLDAPLRTFLRRAPVTCRLDSPLHEAFARMTAERVGSVVVLDGDGRAAGILTLRDVLPRVVLPRLPLETPVSAVMTPAPASLPPSAAAMDAAVLMAQRGVAHLCVVEEGRLVGVISERDLFALQRIGLVNLSRTLQLSPAIPALAAMAANVHVLADRMLAQGVTAGPLIRIVTALNDHTARRAIELVLAQAGTNLPPFAWLAFGSEGRQEQTLKTDQDNGIVFAAAPGAETEAGRSALLPLAARINAALAQCGFPLCRGNIMASNPECCLSEQEWRRRFTGWIDQGSPEHLLRASIFFDLRHLYGAAPLAEGLRQWLRRSVPENPRFLRQLTENALQNRPPLGLVGSLVLESGGDHPGTVDLKLHGTAPFVDGARIFALRQGLAATNTQARLEAAGDSGTVPAGEARTWSESFAYILLLRMRQQGRQKAQGLQPHNHVNPDDLSDLERMILKEALRQARKLQQRLALDYALG